MFRSSCWFVMGLLGYLIMATASASAITARSGCSTFVSGVAQGYKGAHACMIMIPVWMAPMICSTLGAISCAKLIGRPHNNYLAIAHLSVGIRSGVVTDVGCQLDCLDGQIGTGLDVVHDCSGSMLNKRERSCRRRYGSLEEAKRTIEVGTQSQPPLYRLQKTEC